MTVLDALSHRDRFAWAIDIVTGVNDVVWFIFGVGGASTAQVTIPPGRYYGYWEPGAPAWLTNTFPSIYHALATRIDTATGNTWSFRVCTPTVSVKFLNSGVALTHLTGTTTEFGWQFNNVAFTFPKDVLGFSPGEASEKTTTTTELLSPFSRGGDWIAPKRHKSKWVAPKNVQFTGGGSWATRQTTRVRTDLIRLWSYTWIAEGHVKIGKALDQSYATVAELGLGDVNNAFESFWESGFSTGAPVLVVHDEGQTDLAITTHPYEVITFADPAQADEFSAIASIPDSGGRWDIAFAAWVSPDPDHQGYDYR